MSKPEDDLTGSKTTTKKSSSSSSFKFSLSKRPTLETEANEESKNGISADDKKEDKEDLKGERNELSVEDADRDDVPATAPFSSQPIVTKEGAESEPEKKKKHEATKSIDTKNGDGGSDSSSKDKPRPPRKLPVVPPVVLKNRLSRTSTAENSEAGSEDGSDVHEKPAKFSANHSPPVAKKAAAVAALPKKVSKDASTEEEEGDIDSLENQEKKPKVSNDKKRKRDEKTRRNSDDASSDDTISKKPKPKMIPNKKKSSEEEEGESSSEKKKKKDDKKLSSMKDSDSGGGSKKKPSKAKSESSSGDDVSQKKDLTSKSKSTQKTSATTAKQEDRVPRLGTEPPSDPYPLSCIDFASAGPKENLPEENQLKIKEMVPATSYLVRAVPELVKILSMVFKEVTTVDDETVDDETLSLTETQTLDPVFNLIKTIVYRDKGSKKRKVAHKKMMSDIATLLQSYHTSEEVKAFKAAENAYFKSATNFFASRFGFTVYYTPEGLYYIGSNGVKKLIKDQPRKSRTKALIRSKYPFNYIDSDNWTFLEENVASIKLWGREQVRSQTDMFKRVGKTKNLPAVTVRSLKAAFLHLKKHKTFAGSEEAILLAKNVMEAFNKIDEGAKTAKKDDYDMIVSDAEAGEEEAEPKNKKTKMMMKKEESSSEEEEKRRKEDQAKQMKKKKISTKKGSSGSSESSSTAKTSKPIKKKRKQSSDSDD